jgi:hypothetical protein
LFDALAITQEVLGTTRLFSVNKGVAVFKIDAFMLLTFQFVPFIASVLNVPTDLAKFDVTHAVVGTTVEFSVDPGVEVLMSAAANRPETLVTIFTFPR